MLVVPTIRLAHLRVIVLLGGAIVFFWLSLEDDRALSAALMGAGSMALVLIGWLSPSVMGRTLHGKSLWLALIALGALFGAGSAAFAAALMLLKNGLHAHLYPDYPFEMILAMLARAPAWGLAGMLSGAALAMMITALRLYRDA
jgi:hypothetical protein